MQKVYKKTYKSNQALLPTIENFVLDLAKQTKLTKEKINNLEMAVSEASANCMLHGNKNDMSKNIEVTISIEPNSFIVKFKDEGSGFKVDNIPNPILPENILKDNGRGLHIMKSLLDDLEYNFTPTGTEVILTVMF